MEPRDLPGNTPVRSGEDVISGRPIERDIPIPSREVEEGSNGPNEQHALSVTKIRGRKKRVAKPLVSGKLTKKFFMGLSQGLYVASNKRRSPLRPCFEEYAASPARREKQWQRIRARGAQNNLCRVFGSRKDYDAYVGPLLLAYIRKFEKA